jgi:hypothetical protein
MCRVPEADWSGLRTGLSSANKETIHMRTAVKRGRVLLVSIFAVFALAVAGCAADDDDPGDGTTDGDVTTTTESLLTTTLPDVTTTAP